MPQIREQIAMVHLPPSKTLKYLFHVRKTSDRMTVFWTVFCGLFKILSSVFISCLEQKSIQLQIELEFSYLRLCQWSRSMCVATTTSKPSNAFASSKPIWCICSGVVPQPGLKDCTY